MCQQNFVNIRPSHLPISGPSVLHYPQYSVDHGILQFAPILLRVLRGHMDLQFVASGEEAAEYELKTVQYTTKSDSSLAFDTPMCHDNGHNAARAAVDSYRPGHAEIMMGLLRGPGLYLHTGTNSPSPQKKQSYIYIYIYLLTFCFAGQNEENQT